MTLAAITLLLLAGALRTRLVRLYLARYLLRAGNVLGEAGAILAYLEAEIFPPIHKGGYQGG